MNITYKTEQEHYAEIANEIDYYKGRNRDFVLWYLLQDYINETKEEYDKLPTEPKNVNDLALALLYERQIKSAEEMRNILYYKIW